MAHFVIIGAGQAGASLAAGLRTAGFDGDITLLGREDAPPYQRPPLSKAYLLGDMAKERLYLRPHDYYGDHNITLKTGCNVHKVDPHAKQVFWNGESLHYDQLIFAAGTAPRALPAAIGGNLKGIYTLRTLADIEQLRPEFVPNRHVLLIGGGYIGLEAAAVARKMGLKVTLVEAAPRILQRVAAPETANYIRALHQSHGVTFHEHTQITQLEGEERITAVQLGTGERLKVDFAIAGIGVAPETALAEMAGCTIQNGILTNSYGQASVPDLWAIGDCAAFPYKGGHLRLESVGHAIDHAQTVAQNLLGGRVIYQAKPWFWSDQYDCKLQIAGLNHGYDRTICRKHDNGSQSVWYYQGTALLAVDAMNDPRAYMIGKRLIEAGKSPDPHLVADVNVDLKGLL